MRPTFPTPKCHCWNVARDGHAVDCPEFPAAAAVHRLRTAYGTDPEPCDDCGRTDGHNPEVEH